MSMIDALAQKRDALKAEGQAIVAAAEAESRGLTEAEFEKVKQINADRSDVEARHAELSKLAEERKAAAPAVEVGGAKVVSEARTYSREAERRDGVSILRDLLMSRDGDGTAAERLARHRREALVDGVVEQRAVGTGAYAGLVVPQYLTDLVAPLARAGRPFANICTARPLPESGMTVNISRITTGTSAAIQATENAAVSETDMDDTLLTIDVRTIAGQQTVSRQALDRGTGVEEVVLGDLVRAYGTTLDNQLLNGAGTSGTHRGVRNVSGIVAVTYTDASPTAAELWPKLYDLIQQVQAGVFMGISHFVMHPRRWAWLASQVGTSFPFVQQIATAPQVAGVVGTYEYGGVVGSLAGVPVVLDGNMVTNLGVGTNEDVILGVTASELHLWEQPGSPLFLRIDAVSALGVTYAVYGYSAFTAGRYPGAHGTIGGTGLVAPTF